MCTTIHQRPRRLVETDLHSRAARQRPPLSIPLDRPGHSCLPKQEGAAVRFRSPRPCAGARQQGYRARQITRTRAPNPGHDHHHDEGRKKRYDDDVACAAGHANARPWSQDMNKLGTNNPAKREASKPILSAPRRATPARNWVVVSSLRDGSPQSGRRVLLGRKVTPRRIEHRLSFLTVLEHRLSVVQDELSTAFHIWHPAV